VLVSSIDGVGTKTKVAAALGRWETIGADIVAHGANDVLCHGAAPLFMLDYIAAAALRADVTASILQGIASGCRAQGIALLGGETAEMPGVYAPRQVDVAGCTVGAVERDHLLTGRMVRAGDAVVGLASDGLHTNGYSLARAVLLPRDAAAARRALARTPGELSEPLGDALLRPHRCYVPPVLALRDHVEIHAIAHVTGGGIPGNLVRTLPEGCRASVVRGRWPVPPLFGMIQTHGRVADDEMFATLNMGLGLLLVVPRAQAEDAVARLERAGERAWVVGEIAPGVRGVDVRG
jgi:phosphoribosylformylglycinamidine cyclo-ligase